MASENCAKRTQVCRNVGLGISAVVQAVDILRNGGRLLSSAPDLIELAYDADVVSQFQSAVADAATAFTAARDAADAWFDALSTAQCENLVQQKKTHDARRTAEERALSQLEELALAEAQVDATSWQLARDRARLEDAANALGRAQDALKSVAGVCQVVGLATASMRWVPLVGPAVDNTARAVMEASLCNAKAICDAVHAAVEQSVLRLRETKEDLSRIRLHVEETEKELSALARECAELEKRENALVALRQELVQIKGKAYDCAHTVGRALGSARTMDSMLSLSVVAASIRALTDALRTETDAEDTDVFSADLCALENTGLEGLAERSVPRVVSDFSRPCGEL